jgi:hypothetical protein
MPPCMGGKGMACGCGSGLCGMQASSPVIHGDITPSSPHIQAAHLMKTFAINPARWNFITAALMTTLLLCGCDGGSSGDNAASGGNWSSPREIHGDTGSVNASQAPVADSDGNVFLWWLGYEWSTFTFEILARRYDKASDTWGPSVVLSDEVAGNTYISGPLTVDALGNAFLVWRTTPGLDAADSGTLHVKRFDRAAGTWGNLSDVIAPSSRGTMSNTLTTDASGNATLVWTFVSTSGETVVRARRFLASSATWSADTVLTASGSENAVVEQAVTDTSGNVFVRWQEYNSSTSAYSPCVSRFDAALETWQRHCVAATAGKRWEVTRAIADSAGNLTLIGDLITTANSFRTVQAARYSASTNTWSAVAAIEPYSDRTSLIGAAADSAGNITALMYVEDPLGRYIAAARLNMPSGSWATPVRIGDPDMPYSSHIMDMKIDAAGNIAAAFGHPLPDGCGFSVAHYDITTGLWRFTSNRVTLPGWGDIQTIHMGSHGNAYFTYAEPIAGEIRISAVAFNADDNRWLAARRLLSTSHAYMEYFTAALDTHDNFTVAWKEINTRKPRLFGEWWAIRSHHYDAQRGTWKGPTFMADSLAVYQFFLSTGTQGETFLSYLTHEDTPQQLGHFYFRKRVSTAPE